MEVAKNVACVNIFRLHPKRRDALYEWSYNCVVESIYIINLNTKMITSENLQTYNNCIAVMVLDLLQHFT